VTEPKKDNNGERGAVLLKGEGTKGALNVNQRKQNAKIGGGGRLGRIGLDL